MSQKPCLDFDIFGVGFYEINLDESIKTSTSQQKPRRVNKNLDESTKTSMSQILTSMSQKKTSMSQKKTSTSQKLNLDESETNLDESDIYLDESDICLDESEKTPPYVRVFIDNMIGLSGF